VAAHVLADDEFAIGRDDTDRAAGRRRGRIDFLGRRDLLAIADEPAARRLLRTVLARLSARVADARGDGCAHVERRGDALADHLAHDLAWCPLAGRGLRRGLAGTSEPCLHAGLRDEIRDLARDRLLERR